MWKIVKAAVKEPKKKAEEETKEEEPNWVLSGWDERERKVLGHFLFLALDQFLDCLSFLYLDFIMLYKNLAISPVLPIMTPHCCVFPLTQTIEYFTQFGPLLSECFPARA